MTIFDRLVSSCVVCTCAGFFFVLDCCIILLCAKIVESQQLFRGVSCILCHGAVQADRNAALQHRPFLLYSAAAKALKEGSVASAMRNRRRADAMVNSRAATAAMQSRSNHPSTTTESFYAILSKALREKHIQDHKQQQRDKQLKQKEFDQQAAKARACKQKE
jgi:hypothetical protein